MSRKRKMLVGLAIFIVIVLSVSIILAFINEVGYRTNLEIAKSNQAVEIRELPLEKDGLGYWTFTKEAGSNFKILQLTDIHIGNGFLSFSKDARAMDAVKQLVNYAKPDLIIVTGDMVYPVPVQSGSFDNKKATILFAEFMNAFNIPWTITFGNHDYEWYSRYKLEVIAEVYETFDNCLLQRGPEDVQGLSNHFINILNADESINTALALFDSNSYVGYKLHDYDIIHDNQVEWYENEIYNISDFYDVDLVSSLAFFHIPFNEFEDAWKLYKEGSDEITYHFGTVGEPNEKLFIPKERGKLFEKMVELGSTKGVFVGHDHLNDFSITYKGIRLTYGKSIDYLAYYLTVPGFSNSTWQRGGTIIEIDDNGDFEIIQIVLADIID